MVLLVFASGVNSLSILTCCMRASTWILQLAGMCFMPISDWLQLFTPLSLLWYIWCKAFRLYTRDSHSTSYSRAHHENSDFPSRSCVVFSNTTKMEFTMFSFIQIILILIPKYLKYCLKPSIKPALSNFALLLRLNISKSRAKLIYGSRTGQPVTVEWAPSTQPCLSRINIEYLFCLSNLAFSKIDAE